MLRWAQSPCASELGVIEFQPICLEISLRMGCQKYSAMHYLPKLCSQCFLGTEVHFCSLIICIAAAQSVSTSLDIWGLNRSKILLFYPPEWKKVTSLCPSLKPVILLGPNLPGHLLIREAEKGESATSIVWRTMCNHVHTGVGVAVEVQTAWCWLGG